MNYKKWIALAVAFIFIGCAMYTVYAAVLEVGSKGEAVKEVQTRLKKWGFYKGAVDGKYGAGTQAAVKAFQKKNGLKQTGKVDDATAVKMGVQSAVKAGSAGSASSKSAAASNNSDVNLLARVVYAEARGEPHTGKVAVAAVVLNRVDDARFPGSIPGVINQPNAFTCVKNGSINNTPDANCIKAAKDALYGSDPTGGCLYFFNPKTTKNSFLQSLKIVAKIGNHAFAK